jgi:hypothetical protein
MADIDRFHQSYAYLADKTDLDVTEAMGFNPAESRFVLVTKETTTTKIRGEAETARVIALVVTNSLEVNSSGEEKNSTELYAISPPGFDTDYGTFYEYGIEGEVLDIHRHIEEDVIGTQFERATVPEQSTDISHESAFNIIEQAIKAHQENIRNNIDNTPTANKKSGPTKPQDTRKTIRPTSKPTTSELKDDLLSAAKTAKRSRLKQEDLEAAQKRKELEQQKLVDKQKATETRLSNKHAAVFVETAKANNVPTRPLFKRGNGWILRRYEDASPAAEYPARGTNGVIILDNLETYYFSHYTGIEKGRFRTLQEEGLIHAPFLNDTSLLISGAVINFQDIVQ